MSEREKIEAAGIRLMLWTDEEGCIHWRCRDGVVAAANGYYVALPQTLFDAIIEQFNAAERGDAVERARDALIEELRIILSRAGTPRFDARDIDVLDCALEAYDAALDAARKE